MLKTFSTGLNAGLLMSIRPGISQRKSGHSKASLKADLLNEVVHPFHTAIILWNHQLVEDLLRQKPERALSDTDQDSWSCLDYVLRFQYPLILNHLIELQERHERASTIKIPHKEPTDLAFASDAKNGIIITPRYIAGSAGSNACRGVHCKLTPSTPILSND